MHRPVLKRATLPLSLAAALVAALFTVACGGAQKSATSTEVAAATGEKECGPECKKKDCKKNKRKGDCKKGDCKKGDCKKGDCKKGDCKKGDCKKGDCKKKRKGDCKKGDCKKKGDCESGDVAIAMMPAADVKKRLEAKEAVVVIDVNSKERFLKGHLPGAKHANYHALTHLELPKDKAATTVFYCGSSKCHASHKAARAAMAMGYTNVYVMPEGIKGWEAAGYAADKGGQAQKFGVISAADLQQKLQGAAQAHVVDVNSPERYAKGHVPGAIHAKASDLAQAKLPTNKDAMLVFYCGSPRCAASHKAANAAADMGYTNVWVMSDGIKGWESGGLPTQK